MNQQSAVVKTQSHPAGETRDHQAFGRELSEIRGEVRVLKWACGVAVVAILGGMGVLYQNQQTLGRGIQEVREGVQRLDERTIHLDKRLSEIEDLLRVLVARTTSNS